jgi:MarR family transcriptional regulator, transcriptional regulator for hemolysin
MEKLDQVIFYALDKSIRQYRQFAQRRLNEAGVEISIDQWLVLHTIEDRPGISQTEIADQVFKDAASVTRIIELLKKKNYLERKEHQTDRRRSTLELTKEGRAVVKQAVKVSEQNRAAALKGISEKEMSNLRNTLNTIINNCQ